MRNRPTREDCLAAAMAGWCWLAAMLIALACSCAACGAAPNSRVQGAVCRVQNRLPGFNNVGSGTLIDKTDDGSEGLVLTCAHLFREGRGDVLVTFGDGAAHGARLVAVDHQADLAALAIANPTSIPVPTTSVVHPAATLYACGYGPRGEYRCAVGPLVGQAVDTGQLSLMIGGGVRSGDSGGGVFDEQGRLVAVVWGEAGGVTYASSGAPLRSFLNRVLGHESPTLVACQGGNCRWAGPGSGTTRLAPVPARPLDPGCDVPSVVVDPRCDDLIKRVERLEQTKQDRGDYVTRAELGAYASSDQLQHIEQVTTERHANVLKQIGELASARGPGIGGATGKVIAGGLGISGPIGWGVLAATTSAGWLIGRRIKRKRRGARGRRPHPFQ